MGRSATHTIRPIEILFLCTANQCRSAMAEAVLKDRLERRGIDATVHSAGLLEGGFPATDETLKVLADRGLDVSGHRSRQLTVELLIAADLVVGMTRRHVTEAVVTAPAAWPHTFTLKELVRRAQRVGPRRAQEPFADWISRVQGGRQRSELLGESEVDDILDPVAQPRDITYKEARDEIERRIDELVDLIWSTP